MAALELAVSHLHSLGLAHNDLNPKNVVPNTDYMPVLIDFGSCQYIGRDMGPSRGTIGWTDEQEPYTTSEARHDTFALKKFRTWLETPTFDL